MSNNKKVAAETAGLQYGDYYMLALQDLAKKNGTTPDQEHARLTGVSAPSAPSMTPYGQTGTVSGTTPAPGVSAMFDNPDMLSAISSIMGGADNGRTQDEVLSDLLEFTDLTAEEFVSVVGSLQRSADGNPFVDKGSEKGEKGEKDADGDKDLEPDDKEDDEAEAESKGDGEEAEETKGELGDLEMAKEALELLEKLIKSEKKEEAGGEEEGHVEDLLSALELIKKFMFSEADEVHEELHEDGKDPGHEDIKVEPKSEPMPKKIILTNVEPMTGGETMDAHAPMSQKISSDVSPKKESGFSVNDRVWRKADWDSRALEPDATRENEHKVYEEKKNKFLSGMEARKTAAWSKVTSAMDREVLDLLKSGDVIELKSPEDDNLIAALVEYGKALNPDDDGGIMREFDAQDGNFSAKLNGEFDKDGNYTCSEALLYGKVKSPAETAEPAKVEASFKLHDRVWRKADALGGVLNAGDELGRVVDIGGGKVIVDWGEADILAEESPSDIVLAVDAHSEASLFASADAAPADQESDADPMAGPMGMAPEMDLEEVLRETSLFDMLKKHAGTYKKNENEVRHIASGKTGKIVARLSDGSIRVLLEGREMSFRPYEVE